MNYDFSTIAIGDTVILRDGYDHMRSLHKVIKVTKTQITIEGNRVFSRRHGGAFGYGQSHCRPPNIAIPTDDDIANVKAEQDRRDAMSACKVVLQKIEILSKHEDTSTESIKAATKLLYEAARLLVTMNPPTPS